MIRHLPVEPEPEPKGGFLLYAVLLQARGHVHRAQPLEEVTLGGAERSAKGMHTSVLPSNALA